MEKYIEILDSLMKAKKEKKKKEPTIKEKVSSLMGSPFLFSIAIVKSSFASSVTQFAVTSNNGMEKAPT